MDSFQKRLLTKMKYLNKVNDDGFIDFVVVLISSILYKCYSKSQKENAFLKTIEKMKHDRKQFLIREEILENQKESLNFILNALIHARNDVEAGAFPNAEKIVDASILQENSASIKRLANSLVLIEEGLGLCEGGRTNEEEIACFEKVLDKF